jgi:hypothetical protein
MGSATAEATVEVRSLPASIRLYSGSSSSGSNSSNSKTSQNEHGWHYVQCMDAQSAVGRPLPVVEVVSSIGKEEGGEVGRMVNMQQSQHRSQSLAGMSHSSHPHPTLIFSLNLQCLMAGPSEHPCALLAGPSQASTYFPQGLQVSSLSDQYCGSQFCAE